METYVRIGKSILKKFSDFAHDNSLDDEAEYFPVLRIMIEGVIYSFDGPISDKNKIKIKLIEFSKQLYVDEWLQNAREDEYEPDMEMETKDAIERFNELCRCLNGTQL